MAYDVARFNELTKQMSRLRARDRRGGYLERAARRAERRWRLDELAEDINSGCGSDPKAGYEALLRRAGDLLDSDYQPHQAAGRVLYAAAKREQRLTERDQRLQAGEHPGDTDGRYRAAYTYAQRWGLPRRRQGGGEDR